MSTINTEDVRVGHAQPCLCQLPHAQHIPVRPSGRITVYNTLSRLIQTYRTRSPFDLSEIWQSTLSLPWLQKDTLQTVGISRRHLRAGLLSNVAPGNSRGEERMPYRPVRRQSTGPDDAEGLPQGQPAPPVFSLHHAEIVYNNDGDDDDDDDDDDEDVLFPLPTLNDFLSGTAAGISITLVGHPFDTVKVRLQTQDINAKTARRFKGGIDCALATLRKEGFFALYKGMSGPLMTVPAINAIVFATYEQGLSFFRHRQRAREIETGTWGPKRKLDDVGLGLEHIALAGGWAGLVNTLVVGPVELIKSRLQIQFESAKDRGLARFHGPMDCIKDILRTKGVRGLFLGTTATVCREVPAYMGQFYVYEAAKRLFTSPGQTTSDLSAGPLMTAGALAGVAAWLVSYPQDVIKSRIQVQRDDRPRQYRPLRWLPIDGAMVSCARDIYARQGLRGFLVGIGPCLARAVPANAAGFATYEAVSKLLRQCTEDDDD